MNQRPLFDLSRIPRKPAAPVEDDLTVPQIRALQHVYDNHFCPFAIITKFDVINMQIVPRYGFERTRFEGLDFMQWYDLYARGLISRTEGDKSIELTKSGVDLLAQGGWL